MGALSYAVAAQQHVQMLVFFFLIQVRKSMTWTKQAFFVLFKMILSLAELEIEISFLAPGNQNKCGWLSLGCCSCASEDIKLDISQLLQVEPPGHFGLAELQ